jgi:XTP/dITP diphosphohydrolase
MIYFVTGNVHKVREVKAMTNLMIKQAKIPYPEIQAETLREVALFGVEFIREKLKKPFFLEDSGLFIDALGGFPGPYSRYVLEKIGLEGILALLKNKQRRAHFECVIAFADKNTHLFMGRASGSIAEHMQGEKGFGYDPLFIPEGCTRTFAKMDVHEKNLYSHRAKAFRQLFQKVK